MNYTTAKFCNHITRCSEGSGNEKVKTLIDVKGQAIIKRCILQKSIATTTINGNLQWMVLVLGNR